LEKFMVIKVFSYLIISFWHIFRNDLSHGKCQAQNNQDLAIKCCDGSLKGITVEQKKIEVFYEK